MTISGLEQGFLSKSSVVTFDIFDTLLHRLTKAPVDVFEMVRMRAFEDERSLYYHDLLDSFAKSRWEAERDARDARFRQHGGEGEITLDEIYAQWAQDNDAPQEVADWLKSLELDSEQRVFYASQEGLKLYSQALSEGKKIAFLSDMYLPSEWLTDRLLELGYTQAKSHPTYVSGEVRVSKGSGALYNHVAEAEGWALDSSWVHIGDNRHADVKQARAAGINGHHATWAKVDNVPTERCSIFAGDFIYSLVEGLSLPQAAQRLPEDPLERIGYQVWGPMLFGYVCWLMTQFKEKEIDRALFVARDGWLMKHLYELCRDVSPMPGVETEYFYMSRKTGYKTGARDWDPERAWNYIGGKTDQNAERAFLAANLSPQDYQEMLNEKGISDFKEPLNPSQRESVFGLLNEVHFDVLKKSVEMRTRFGAYYDRALEGSERLALVDIGWVGNLQRCFSHSLSDPTAYQRVEGFYVSLHRDFVHPNQNLGLPMQGWLNASDRYEEFNTALLTGGVELMEFVLTADHGSTIDLAQEGDQINPVLETQGEQEREHQRLAAKAQAGVIKFVEDYRFLLEIFSPATISSPIWAEFFLQMAMHPTNHEVEQLADITHSDSPGGNMDRIVLAPKLPAGVIKSKRDRMRARDQAYWKAAFDLRNP